MTTDWSQFIAAVPPPSNGVSPEIKALCHDYGLHSYIGVLCGWDWAPANKDVKPIYEMELNTGKSKVSFSTKDSKVASEVMRIYRK
jgi:hypothetical protein